MSRVSVVIVTYNGEPWIRRNLLSLRSSSLSAQVVIVDNASTDSTVDIVGREFSDVQLITQSDNTGFGLGNNIGISWAIAHGSEFIFLLNQDAYVTPTTIEELTDFMDRHADFGVVSPLHCSPDLNHVDRKTFRAYLQTYASDFLCDAALERPAPYYRIRGINAAAWFIRTSTFIKTGGFDPMFFMYGEDDDLIARFAHHDVPFGLLPHSRVVHLREMAPSMSAPGFWRDVTRGASRARSSLIAAIKDPGYSVGHMALKLISRGILRPLANFIIDRNSREFLSTLAATGQLLFEIPAIRRHARQCAIPGPHFLTCPKPVDFS